MIGGGLLDLLFGAAMKRAAGKLNSKKASTHTDDMARQADNIAHHADDAAYAARKQATKADELCNSRVPGSRCFAPDTLVATPEGPRPISELREGDVVLAFNFQTGVWNERRVTERHESLYEGPLATIGTDHGVVRTTIYHPFWVADGWDLEERPRPRELAPDEDERLSLDGRWVNSHDLRVGDVLIGRDGSRRTVLKIEQEFKSGFPVNNLTIEDHHTFAVGPDAILVHNTTGCPVWDAAAKRWRDPSTGRFVAAPKGMQTPQVTDPKLKNLVSDLYKGAKGRNPVGTGSTADAVRSELITRSPTHGRFHSQKAQEYVNALTKWLRRNPNAAHHDRLVAQSILNDLNAALGGN